MKKREIIAAILLVILMVFSFASCETEKKNENKKNQNMKNNQQKEEQEKEESSFDILQKYNINI
ncbi:hypothetical protein [Oceanirhabdus sp. W0125-5]|uniref:hypothetical protein n=1 Tax=Oceanirhabdus sp. W0125-5 TaxID=2999116 RepID=UPI0022F2E4D6|nr:hypothetical protein [Oceanirhabdus sp. W0125-5]WBW97350.1 hypothetical protein OW730_00415 [Oceanirhabdus sp. W0125-5]